VRLRIHALAFLGALAFLLASTGSHVHPDGLALERACAVCTAQAQSSATCPELVSAAAHHPQISLELFRPAPLSRDLQDRGSAAPRGPPAIA